MVEGLIAENELKKQDVARWKNMVRQLNEEKHGCVAGPGAEQQKAFFFERLVEEAAQEVFKVAQQQKCKKKRADIFTSEELGRYNHADFLAEIGDARILLSFLRGVMTRSATLCLSSTSTLSLETIASRKKQLDHFLSANASGVLEVAIPEEWQWGFGCKLNLLAKVKTGSRLIVTLNHRTLGGTPCDTVLRDRVSRSVKQQPLLLDKAPDGRDGVAIADNIGAYGKNLVGTSRQNDGALKSEIHTACMCALVQNSQNPQFLQARVGNSPSTWADRYSTIPLDVLDLTEEESGVLRAFSLFNIEKVCAKLSPLLKPRFFCQEPC